MSAWRSIKLIVRAAFIELMRRRDPWVLLLLMGLFFVGALVARGVGIENEATAAFLVNLGLTMAWLFAHILTVLMAARQIPNEIENRTLYPLLARPLSRNTVLIGKWLAATLAGSAAFLVLALMGWLPVPKAGLFANGLFAQALLLAPVSIAMAAAIAVAFSLFLPRAVANTLALALVIAGDKLAAFLGREPGGLAGWFAAYLPDFSKLNLVLRYTDGIAPLAAHTFTGLVLYGAIITAAALAAGMWQFNRRAL